MARDLDEADWSADEAVTRLFSAHYRQLVRLAALLLADRAVAEELGNTPAVAKASYVDPRVVDLYHDGVTVSPPRRFSRPALESAVLRLLRDA